MDNDMLSPIFIAFERIFSLRPSLSSPYMNCGRIFLTLAQQRL